jgi:hypothetical protein
LFSGKSDDKPLANRSLMFAGLYIIIGIAVLMILIELTIESNEVNFKKFKNYLARRRSLAKNKSSTSEVRESEELVVKSHYEQPEQVFSAGLVYVKPSSSRTEVDVRKRAELAKSIIISDLSVIESTA